MLPTQFSTENIRPSIEMIATSFAHWLGKPLVEGPLVEGDAAKGDVVAALWEAPHVIVAHGTEADPVFFFGNQAALTAFETNVADFIQMPSRLSAELPARDERKTMLDRVTRHGFIDDYSGVRVTVTGRRFRIDSGIVWNLVDAEGNYHGQAATFAAP